MHRRIAVFWLSIAVALVAVSTPGGSSVALPESLPRSAGGDVTVQLEYSATATEVAPPAVAVQGRVEVARSHSPVTEFDSLGGSPSTAEVREMLRLADEQRREAPIAVVGIVSGESGPMAGATVEIDGSVVTTGLDGRFRFAEVRRRNHIARIDADGHVSRVVGVVADREMAVDLVDVAPVQLLPLAEGRHTMIFGGDASLGRRYIDPAEAAARDELPEPQERALISLDETRSDTAKVVADLSKMIAPYDLASINLETVVTREPSGPEETQRYVLYMLPESVDALADAGVDHVTLGNNHVWDYGEQGVVDTHNALDAAGIEYSGSGSNADEAFTPSIITAPSGDLDIAIHSWVAIENIPAPYPPHATESKGGGANLNDMERVAAEVRKTEMADMLTIAVPHVGYEYTEQPAPSDPVQFVQDRLYTAADAGADLVVAHHPHLAQGFEYRDGTLIAHSLGNLIFDQPRLDTLFGAMLAVAFDGQELIDARVEPVYIQGFEPTIAAGEPADLLLRRLSYLGAPDVVLAADAGGGRILTRAEAVESRRTVVVPLEVGADGAAMIDLRHIRLPGESVIDVSGVDPDSVTLGRDIMVLGDAEDHDFDDVREEVAPWKLGSSSEVCGSQARRGTGALCSLRSDANDGASAIAFGQRIRVVGDRINEPNRDLTLLLYERGLNRGDLVVNASYRSSQGTRQFGDEVLGVLPARDGDYQAHWLQVNLPPENQEFIDELPVDRPFRMRPQFRSARAVRLSVDHHPPLLGAGVAAIDDVALVSWERPEVLNGHYRTPSPFDFIRVTNAESVESVRVVLSSFTPPGN